MSSSSSAASATSAAFHVDSLGIIDKIFYNKYATKLQRIFRGHLARRRLWVRTLAARIIQRFYRSIQARLKFGKYLKKLREKSELDRGHRSRMRKIYGQEKSFNVLNKMDAGEFLKYETIRREHSARVIQSFLRRKADRWPKVSTREPGMPHLGMAGAKFAKPKDRALLKEQLEQRRSMEQEQKDKALRDYFTRMQTFVARDGLLERIQSPPTETGAARSRRAADSKLTNGSSTNAGGATAGRETDGGGAFDYLKFSKLYDDLKAAAERKIREDKVAAIKQSEQDRSKKVYKGQRGLYQDLLQAQQKYRVIYDEYLQHRQEILREETDIKQLVDRSKRSLDVLRKLPSLDEASRTIRLLSVSKSSAAAESVASSKECGDMLHLLRTAQQRKAAAIVESRLFTEQDQYHYNRMDQMKRQCDGRWSLQATADSMSPALLNLELIRKYQLDYATYHSRRTRTTANRSDDDLFGNILEEMTEEESLRWSSYARAPTVYGDTRGADVEPVEPIEWNVMTDQELAKRFERVIDDFHKKLEAGEVDAIYEPDPDLFPSTPVPSVGVVPTRASATSSSRQ